MPELHDLVAPYAVDALDSAERVEFEKHLGGCERCRTELAELRPAVVELAELAEVTPPADMRASVLEAITTTPQEWATGISIDAATDHGAIPPSTQVIALGERRALRWRRLAVGFAAAAAAVIVIVTTAGGQVSLEDITAAPDSATVQLEGDVGSASFVYSDSLDAGAFIAASLPLTGSGQTYQLWLIDGAVPRSAGIFVPAPDGSVEFLFEAPIARGQVVGLTLEPAGGSEAPTGDVLLAQELG